MLGTDFVLVFFLFCALFLCFTINTSPSQWPSCPTLGMAPYPHPKNNQTSSSLCAPFTIFTNGATVARIPTNYQGTNQIGSVTMRFLAGVHPVLMWTAILGTSASTSTLLSWCTTEPWMTGRPGTTHRPAPDGTVEKVPLVCHPILIDRYLWRNQQILTWVTEGTIRSTSDNEILPKNDVGRPDRHHCGHLSTYKQNERGGADGHHLSFSDSRISGTARNSKRQEFTPQSIGGDPRSSQRYKKRKIEDTNSRGQGNCAVLWIVHRPTVFH